MSSCFGENIKITVFGQSHSEAIGVVIDGFPCGFAVNEAELAAFMSRRAPGNAAFSTARREADKVEFVSGITCGKTNGAPIAAIIRNTDAHPQDYESLTDSPRPGHADYTARIKYGSANDASGGGHFSGRLTAPLCVAGGLCLQWLEAQGVSIGAHIAAIHSVEDEPIDSVNIGKETLTALKAKSFACLSDDAAVKMQAEIEAAKRCGNSVGGVIECVAVGLPVGVGEPMFGGLENRISLAVFGIPAVKGIEFGVGFESARLFGTSSNDEFYYNDAHEIRTKTNNCGGILGGISNGMPLVFRAAFKPTPSVAAEQSTVSLSTGENVKISVGGRHDPCIVPRAVPCVEAAAALAIADLMLSAGANS